MLCDFDYVVCYGGEEFVVIFCISDMSGVKLMV